MRLGCAGKTLGKPGLKSYDARRRDHDPHLSISLAYVRDILCHLDQAGIRFYRLSAKLAPYVHGNDDRDLTAQIDDCRAELAFVGDLARGMNTRLSIHAPLHTVLTCEEEVVANRGARELRTLANILDGMSTGPEAVVVLHVGGVYDDRRAAVGRFQRRFARLPEFVRRRIALENDGRRYSLADVWQLSHTCECPIVFDRLHFLLHNPEGLPLDEALQMALESWPPNTTPIVHFSSPRTDVHFLTRGRGVAAQHSARAPSWSRHSDYVNPFGFIAFVESARGLGEFDVMLEAKAKDLAVIRLREDLKRYAPSLAGRLVNGRSREPASEVDGFGPSS